jgi:hypothetical protein
LVLPRQRGLAASGGRRHADAVARCQWRRFLRRGTQAGGAAPAQRASVRVDV